MARLATVKFSGNSGGRYEFDVYEYPFSGGKDYSCVYFVTHRHRDNQGKFTHDHIYVGETEDLEQRHSNHHRKLCFSRNNANAICLLRENSGEKRRSIEKDLRLKYDPLCNRE